MHAELVVFTGSEAGRRFVLRPGQSFVLGRASTLPIVINDTMVSRKHARVELSKGKLLLTDMGSSNGTYVEGVALEPNVPRLLGDKDIFQVGEQEIAVELHGHDTDAHRRLRRNRSTDQPLIPGDEYELVEELGAGGLGRVWAARCKFDNSMVAIKVLRDEIAEDDRNRFLREAWLACQVRCQYVVEVYDLLGVAEGRPALVMELVQGPSALDRVKSYGPLSFEEALRIGENVAQALIVAAELGVVHRDVKPHNILLTQDGVAKLADFGIAKSVAAPSFTEAELGLGSLPYVAPEQAAEARTVDPRADLYSLGATLYHLIGGRAPFPIQKSRNTMQILREVMAVPPLPLSEYRSDVPQDVEDLVMALLNKDPDDRPQPIEVVAKTLHELWLAQTKKVARGTDSMRSDPETSLNNPYRDSV